MHSCSRGNFVFQDVLSFSLLVSLVFIALQCLAPELFSLITGLHLLLSVLGQGRLVRIDVVGLLLDFRLPL